MNGIGIIGVREKYNHNVKDKMPMEGEKESI
jgi:hypothetical protein